MVRKQLRTTRFGYTRRGYSAGFQHKEIVIERELLNATLLYPTMVVGLLLQLANRSRRDISFVV